MIKDDNYFMLKALAQAKLAYQEDEVPVGAIIVDDNCNIISRAHNQCIGKNNVTYHAEILALSKACKKVQNYRLNNLTMYVTLEPCAMCAGAIIHARLKRIVIGALDPKTGACGSVFNIINNQANNHQLIISKGVLEKECSRIISQFFKQKRLIKKITRYKI